MRFNRVLCLLVFLLFWASVIYAQDESDFKLFRRGIIGKDISCSIGPLTTKEYLSSGLFVGIDYMARTGDNFYLGGATGVSSLTGKNLLKSDVIMFPLEVKGRFATRGVSWLFIEAGAGYYSFMADADSYCDVSDVCDTKINGTFGAMIGAGLMLQVTSNFNMGLSVSKRFLKTKVIESKDHYDFITPSLSGNTTRETDFNLGSTYLALNMVWRI